MFNKDEMSTILLCTGYGAAAGAVLCGILFVYSLFAEAWNCFCDCFGGCNSLPEVNSGITFLFAFLICLGIGLLVGLFLAFSDRSSRIEEEERKRAEANSAEAKQQRIKWAKEVKHQALNIAKICSKNYKEYNDLVSPKYKAAIQMELIINELANATELKGKVDAMAINTKTNGGLSK